jgi:hypothetical protein
LMISFNRTDFPVPAVVINVEGAFK